MAYIATTISFGALGQAGSSNRLVQDTDPTPGAEHTDTFSSMSNLAFNYGNQGLWRKDEKLQVQILETGKRVVITANVPSPVVSL